MAVKSCLRCQERPRDQRHRLCCACRNLGEEGRRRKAKAHKSGRNKQVYVFAALSRDEWLRLYNYRDGGCHICGKKLRNRYDPNPDLPIGYTDHSHQREKAVGLRASIRGILCLRCNRRLLHAGSDDPVLFRAAAAYLEDPPAYRLIAVSVGELDAKAL